MNNRLGWMVFGCLAMSIAIVAVLFIMSSEMKSKHNSFLRLFPSHPVLEGNSLDLQVNSYYLAGGTAHHIYLGNYSSPLHLLILNTTLTDSQHVKLNVKGIMDQKFWSVRVKVDSPNFYVTDGAVPRIYKGNVCDWNADRFLYDQEYFLDIEPMNSNSFAIKSLNKNTEESMLGKIASDSPHYQFKPSLLQKQIDGFFCTDGKMHYDKELDRLVYLYRYRNQYMVMDSSLNLVFRGKTIDTISRAKITIATVASNGSRTMASPPLVVNKQSAVQGKWLFVDSNLLAKNEHPKALGEADVVDVYDLTNSNYQFSFYIFRYNRKEKMKEFGVYGNKLIALFESHIQVYDLRIHYFQTITKIVSENLASKNILRAYNQD